MKEWESSKALMMLVHENLRLNNQQFMAIMDISAQELEAWKNGAYIPFKHENRIRDMLGLGEIEPKFVLLCGSIDDAQKWESTLKNLAIKVGEEASLEPEIVDDFDDQSELHSIFGGEHSLALRTFELLRNIGAEIPKTFPKELELRRGKLSKSGLEAMQKHPLTNFIYQTYAKYVQLCNIFQDCLDEFVDEEDAEDILSITEEMEANILNLAVCHMDEDDVFAPQLFVYKKVTREKYQRWMLNLMRRAEAKGVELKLDASALLGEEMKTSYPLKDSEKLEITTVPESDESVGHSQQLDELVNVLHDIHNVLNVIAQKL